MIACIDSCCLDRSPARSQRRSRLSRRKSRKFSNASSGCAKLVLIRPKWSVINLDCTASWLMSWSVLVFQMQNSSHHGSKTRGQQDTTAGVKKSCPVGLNAAVFRSIFHISKVMRLCMWVVMLQCDGVPAKASWSWLLFLICRNKRHCRWLSWTINRRCAVACLLCRK